MTTTEKFRSLRVKFHLNRLTGGLTLYNLFISKLSVAAGEAVTTRSTLVVNRLWVNLVLA